MNALEWTFLVLFIGSIVAVLALVTLAIRGRLVPSAAACARCRHQVGDAPLADGRKCAECGNSLEGDDAVRYFAWQWRPLLLGVAAVVALVGIGGSIAAALVVDTQARRTATSSVPEMIEAVRESGSQAWPALSGLASRTGSLTDDELTAAIDALAEACGKGGFEWMQVEMADLTAAAQSRGLLTAEARRAIATVGFDSSSPLDLDVADDIRAGEKRMVWMAGPSTMGLSSRVATLTSVRMGDRDLPLVSPYPQATELTFDFEPGEYDLVATFRSAYTLTTTAGPMAPLMIDETRTRRIRVHPADGPTWLDLVTDESLRASVLRAVAARAVSADALPDGRCAVRTDLVVLPCRVPLAFRVTVDIGGTTYPMGERWSHRRDSGAAWSSGPTVGYGPVPDPSARTATLILTPAPSALEQQRGVRRTWGEEIRIEVPVVRGTEGTLPFLPPAPAEDGS